MSKCKYRREEYCAYIDQYCVEGPCPYEEPQTNADRIRALSDVELATWLTDFCCATVGNAADARVAMYHCGMLEWLKQEVTDEGH